MKKAIIVSLVLCFHSVFAETKEIPPREMRGFETVFEAHNQKLGFHVFGTSMLKSGQLLKEATVEVPDMKKYKILSVWLFWSGVIGKDYKNINKIIFVDPQKKKHFIESKKIKLAQDIYACFSDVTALFSGQGKYGVEGLFSETYENAGWAMAVVYEDQEAAKNSSIIIKAGVARLKPGELYYMKLTEGKEKYFASKISLIGGHAIPGNGSSSLLNDRALGMKGDWDGSSGEKWDIDTFDIINYKIEAHPQVILTIDPLLQWIFPVAFILKTELVKD